MDDETSVVPDSETDPGDNDTGPVYQVPGDPAPPPDPNNTQHRGDPGGDG